MDADVVLDRRLDKQTLAPLLHKSDTRGLVHFGLHLGLFAASGAAVWLARPTWWLLPPALLLHGLVLVAFFAPAHETIHRTAFRSRWLNTLVGWWCGLLLLLPPNYFRAFHFAHHIGTQDPARDPELAFPRPATWRQYLWHVTGLPYWIYQARIAVTHALGRVREPFATPRMQHKIVVEARVLLALIALLVAGSIALQSWALLWLWVLPGLLGQPFLRLYLLAEHWGCPQVPDMLANTRTTLTNGWVRFLAWNMPFHVEHHAYPAVPFHRLPRLHGLICGQAQVVATGYGAFTRQVWRALR